MTSNNQISFPRIENEVTIAAYPEGIFIVYGWTMSLTLSKVRQYVKDFGRNSQKDVDEGFFLHDGKFILSHSGAKMTFSSDEASKLIDFLVRYYNIPLTASNKIVDFDSIKDQTS